VVPVRLLVAGLLLLAGLVALPSGAGASQAPAGFKKCGTFHDGRQPIHVDAKHVSCRLAMKVQKEYFLGPESEQELVGPDEYNGYVRLKRFPGWRCTSGAGAGNCAKGRKDAFYSTFPE
jgi:hypothetical protein